jgi:DNA-binding transcriptional ArsR family regulator
VSTPARPGSANANRDSVRELNHRKVRAPPYNHAMGVWHPTRDQIELDTVLAALGHPVRLAIVRALAAGPVEGSICGTIDIGVTKATATHHWRALREAGIIRQWQVGRNHLVALRREDLEEVFPGLINIVVRTTAEPSR